MKTLNIEKAIHRLSQNIAIASEQMTEAKEAGDLESERRILGVIEAIQLVQMMLQDCSEDTP